MVYAPKKRTSSSAETKALPAFYYLDNFLALIRSVNQYYDDLLSDRERTFYCCFMDLEQSAQALYVRLLGRRGDCFRLSKIYYFEIDDISAAVKTLVSAGLLEYVDTMALAVLFPLYTKAEWLKGIAEAPLKSLKRDALFEYINTHKNMSKIIANVMAGDKLPLVRLVNADVFDTFKLLYFCNGRQSLTDFILRDLGINRYECYRLDKQSRFFESREQIANMLAYYQLRNQLEDLSEWSEEQLFAFYQDLPPQQLLAGLNQPVDRVLDRRMQRLRMIIARQLERLHALQLALPIYRECPDAPSRERQARILQKLGKLQDALALCETILEQGSEAEKNFAREFSPRLARQLKLPVSAAVRFKANCSNLTLEQSKKYSVEQLVVQSLSNDGQCFFLENKLVLGVFGLVFWSAIFADIRGAFSHPFQGAPHDLYDSDFFEKRQPQVADCWRKLSDWIACPQQMLAFMQHKQGFVNPFVDWQWLTETIFEQALQRVPEPHWRLLFERLCSNLRDNRNGLPDLVFFPKAGGYEFIEVKGPGDRLQKNQTRWLQFFHQHEIPYRVCCVDWKR